MEFEIIISKTSSVALPLRASKRSERSPCMFNQVESISAGFINLKTQKYLCLQKNCNE
jgi:hypothetical protein